MVTIIDVAKKSGISKSTISRYLNGGVVRETNRRKIEKTIKELNYNINPMARGLKTSKSYTIGVIIPNITDLFVTYIIQSCESYLNGLGYSIILCDAKEDIEIEKKRLEFLKRKRVDGIIIQPCTDRGEHIINASKEVPVVLIDRNIHGIELDCVLVNNYDISYNGISELIKRGHRKIGIIKGPPNIYTACERFKGYYMAMNDFNIPINQEYIKNGDFNKNIGKAAFLELMKMSDRPTAIFITNYFMALGAIEAILEKGYNIPRDVSLLIFDSIETSTAVDWTAIFKPRLSTIRQPMTEIGQKAAQLIMERIENKRNYTSRIVLHAQLNMTDSAATIL